MSKKAVCALLIGFDSRGKLIQLLTVVANDRKYELLRKSLKPLISAALMDKIKKA
jgi:hypothetical protein